MSRKPKFKPEITRIKLNPEQAVLTCSCYSQGARAGYAVCWYGWHTRVCEGNWRIQHDMDNSEGYSASS